jgi:hypothetical protein
LFPAGPVSFLKWGRFAVSFIFLRIVDSCYPPRQAESYGLPALPEGGNTTGNRKVGML